MQLVSDEVAFSPERYDRLHDNYCKLDERSAKMEDALKTLLLYMKELAKDHKEPWKRLVKTAEEALAE